MLVDKVALGRRIKAMRQNLEMTQPCETSSSMLIPPLPFSILPR